MTHVKRRSAPIRRHPPACRVFSASTWRERRRQATRSMPGEGDATASYAIASSFRLDCLLLMTRFRFRHQHRAFSCIRAAHPWQPGAAKLVAALRRAKAEKAGIRIPTVSATPMTSRNWRPRGMAAIWMGDGSVYPIFSTACAPVEASPLGHNCPAWRCLPPSHDTSCAWATTRMQTAWCRCASRLTQISRRARRRAGPGATARQLPATFPRALSATGRLPR